MTDEPLTPGRLCLVVAFVLLTIAALASFGVAVFGQTHPSPAGFGLLGLAFWALSGALD